jgi:hypothetical protein
VKSTVAVEGSAGGALVADAVEDVDAGEHAATSATTTTAASATLVRLICTSPHDTLGGARRARAGCEA